MESNTFYYFLDTTAMNNTISKEEWVEARKALLKKEKEFTALRDQLSQQRHNLPWVAVNKEYVFEGRSREYKDVVMHRIFCGVEVQV